MYLAIQQRQISPSLSVFSCAQIFQISGNSSFVFVNYVQSWRGIFRSVSAALADASVVSELARRVAETPSEDLLVLSRGNFQIELRYQDLHF